MESKNETFIIPRKHSLRDEFGKYLKFWPWFLICLLLTMGAAWLYLKYATPIYKASSTIVINEESGGGSESEMSAYSSMGFVNGLQSNDLDKELAILKSRRLMREVVKALNINVQFFNMDGPIEKEMYKNLPFSFQILKLDDEKLKRINGVILEISYKNENEYKLTNSKSGKIYILEAGKPFDLGYADLVIGSVNKKQIPFSNLTVKFNHLDKIGSYYRGKIQIIQVKDNSNVLEIQVEDPVKEKTKDIIDQLIFEFNRDAIEDKNLIAGNTAQFINRRLDIINDELESVESGKEEFKETNRLTDLGAESQMYIQNASEYNKKLQDVTTQMELSKAMLEYISSASNSELLPANLGIQGGAVNQQINENNDLILERNRILSSSTEKNPTIVRLNNQINQIRSNIVQGLRGMQTNLQIARDDLSRQASSIGSRILAVPSQERQYRGIERQQDIKEALYLFLLRKREENSLALAVTAPKAKIVDKAYNTGGVVSPNSGAILLGSLVLGLFIPFSVIYLKSLFNNKIRSREDLEGNQEIPIIGEVPKIKRKEGVLIKENDRSILAESFRILLSNMHYLRINYKDKETGVIAFVTSSVKGEGKTFVSLNLGITLANAGHKVVLVGGDLRNPKLNKYVSKENSKLGVSDYLASNELELTSLIHKSEIHDNLDLLISGTIPPNPSELLNQDKTGKMFQKLGTFYDYVIVDTAPSMMVADTFFITKYADVVLYIVRAGYTESKLMEFATSAKKSGSIKNVGFILNDVSKGNLGYGNKYGYGYGAEKEVFWRRTFSLK
ncbi:capsular exopolysaccharide synthesis family protein [Gillisia mitskevichiae]|uniref:non-specific protein-tyrosine kinase n=1 Tax=Gillisia mitskevichiae TaxID=270921 RepID=A0A495PWR0_9FLAO|nr:tyrosine-protein kinase [Gillisia mitskevichiae]RKS53938.1 capsular exopolysaccharide synthesis family protein [Gillisia mitskevichiae]